MKCSMIHAERVSKRFGTTPAVVDASLCADRGEFVALLGPSGCGKTTLLRLIAGFEAPDAGAVDVAGRRVAGNGTWVPPEKRRVGMMFQDYALFPHLTVAANIGFGVDRSRRSARVREVSACVGLDGLEQRYPHELSGGQQQRVALARALAPEPELVLLDEPWSNVDPSLRASLRDEIVALLRTLDVTTVLVTHDREEAFSIADRIALMRDGTVVQEGSPEALYLSPASRWAAEFVGAGNFVPGLVRDGTRGHAARGVPRERRLRRAHGGGARAAGARRAPAGSHRQRPRSSAGSSAATTSSTASVSTGSSSSRTGRRQRRSLWGAACA